MPISEGSPDNPVILDPFQSIVDFKFGVTGGGSGSTSSMVDPPSSYAPATHMGSTATGAATTDGDGIVTLPNSGTYTVSLAGDGGGGGSGSMSVALQDQDTNTIYFSVTQSGSGTVLPSGTGTFPAPGGMATTFRVECVLQVTGFTSPVMVSILAQFSKIS